MEPLVKAKGVLGAAVVLGTLLAAGAGLALWKRQAMRHAAANSAPFEPTESIEVVEARPVRWRQTAELVGTAVAIQSITLSNEVAGSVTEVLFESGSTVKAGQVLIRMDNSVERADLAAAEASVRIAEANVRAADANLHLAQSSEQRLTQAAEARAASSMDVDRAQADVAGNVASRDRMRADVDHAKAKVDQLRALIAKKTLVAPFDAIAGMRAVHPGQYLAEGSTVVGLQGVSSAIYVDFALPQEQVRRVKPGDVVMATSGVFGADPVRIEVVAIDATADRVTRNVRVRSRVENPGGALRPGMFVDVNVPVGPEAEYVAVPTTAVRRAAYGDHVFVVAEDPATKQLRARQRNVRLGPAIGAESIVLEGLATGERLAALGSFKLREGALVAPASPARDAPASAPAASVPADDASRANR